MTIKQITQNITQINNDSNIYIIKDLNLAIDAGNKQYFKQTKEELNKTINPKQIKSVILTHIHYDHIGCYTLFPNAKFYASDKIIEDYNQNKLNYILSQEITNEFNKIQLHPISELELPKQYQIIETPGHCKSCICIYDKENQILFSGDTLFDNNMVGRTDLPKSEPEKQENSLNKLKQLDIKILCPGHNY